MDLVPSTTCPVTTYCIPANKSTWYTKPTQLLKLERLFGRSSRRHGLCMYAQRVSRDGDGSNPHTFPEGCAETRVTLHLLFPSQTPWLHVMTLSDNLRGYQRKLDETFGTDTYGQLKRDPTISQENRLRLSRKLWGLEKNGEIPYSLQTWIPS